VRHAITPWFDPLLSRHDATLIVVATTSTSPPPGQRALIRAAGHGEEHLVAAVPHPPGQPLGSGRAGRDLPQCRDDFLQSGRDYFCQLTQLYVRHQVAGISDGHPS
jgi:hypothetical protein